MTSLRLTVINLLRGIETKSCESLCSDVKVCLLSLLLFPLEARANCAMLEG